MINAPKLPQNNVSPIRKKFKMFEMNGLSPAKLVKNTDIAIYRKDMGIIKGIM